MTDSTQFRTVLRGYEPSQVEEHLRSLTAAPERAQRFADEAQKWQGRAQAKQEAPSAPTFADLGERVGEILTPANQEAVQMRTEATADAAAQRKDAEATAKRVKADAESHAAEVRSGAEAQAAQLVAEARRKAENILDEADRDATARREEAEAIYEQQRAKSAKAATDFETTLAERRE